MEDQLTEEERMGRDSAHAYVQGISTRSEVEGKMVDRPMILRAEARLAEDAG